MDFDSTNKKNVKQLRYMATLYQLWEQLLWWMTATMGFKTNDQILEDKHFIINTYPFILKVLSVFLAKCVFLYQKHVHILLLENMSIAALATITAGVISTNSLGV